MQITNPIIGGFHPDPSICRVGDDYYLVTSSFEYFPGVPIFHSRDLANWTQIGHCLTRPEQLPLPHVQPSAGIWAPTIRYHQGVFYMVTTNMTRGGNFYVTATDPAGEWSDPVWFDAEGWDPSLFFDDDGTVYLTRAQGDPVEGAIIVQYRLDLQIGKPLEAPRILWNNGTEFGLEAPHLFKRGEYYYLTIAAGGTHMGHVQLLVRSHSPWGPFEMCPYNPILTHRHRLFRLIQATAHMDLVETPDGNWWAVCLGIRNYGSLLHAFHHLGRETFLTPARWTDDGWLLVNEGQGVPEILEMDVPASAALPVRDDFDTEQLAPVWNFVGNPSPQSWSLQTRPGWLMLHTNLIGRRQTDPSCIVRTLLAFDPQHAGDEAGISVYMNPDYRYDLAIRQTTTGRELIFRRKIGDLDLVTVAEWEPSTQVQLEIHATAHEYTFHYLDASGQAQILASGASKFVSSEFAGGFTGVYIALYAGLTAAYFDWFEYRPV
jgi:alpha-N-arabinofuranosidase